MRERRTHRQKDNFDTGKRGGPGTRGGRELGAPEQESPGIMGKTGHEERAHRYSGAWKRKFRPLERLHPERGAR